jgi:2-polyprenyl-3-methyl-5-hydroxy-6-metoxy-1,4-benzoquinol methylase
MQATGRIGKGPSRIVKASFRDPGGCLLALDGRIFRIVNASGEPEVAAFLGSAVSRRLFDSGLVVRSEVLGDARVKELSADPAVAELFEAADRCLVVEHERVPFQSFPYEWPAEMLHAAGLLTIELAQELLPEDLGLKDGTPYNVLFRGSEPVFVDVLSFERRQPCDPIWLPYAQFVRTFMLPLLADKHFGFSTDRALLTYRDGIEPEQFLHWLSPLQKIREPFFSLVSLPSWLGALHKDGHDGIYKQRILRNPEKARFILRVLLRRLQKRLEQLKPRAKPQSRWSEYMISQTHYSAGAFQTKEAFVRQALADFTPHCVLDVGANTGHFSLMAAECGARVVSIDCDSASVGQLWLSARARRLDVLPLVVNLACPTPGTGWQNAECASFLDRAHSAFDAVLMLAVVHHLLVTERVPLAQIMELASDLSTNLVLIEFVGPEDPMFRRITRGRDALHEGYNVEFFEAVSLRYFDIVRSCSLEGTSRRLYVLRKKS